MSQRLAGARPPRRRYGAWRTAGWTLAMLVADGLSVVARAPDGVIEAVELASHPWLIGVQWHPELTADKDAAQQRLFDVLVEVARNGAERNRASAP